MSCQVQLQGTIAVTGGCGCDGGLVTSPSNKIQGLGFACGAVFYPAVKSTDCPTQITTAGVLGAAWKELPATEGFASLYLLAVRGQSPYKLRIGAGPATLDGSGGTFPTSFGGGETFAFTADGTAVAVTFTAAAQSALQVAQEINQATIGAGLTWLPASVASSGQLQLSGLATGSQGSLAITTPNATIGFAAASSAVGKGEDIDSQGLFMNQFDQSTAPSRVQISGNVQVEVFAAGVAA